MILPNPNIKTIAVFRALQLGDLLCSVPAFRALRGACPSAHVTLIGMPWMKTFAERFSGYFDEFTWFPGYPGLPEQHVDPKQTIAFLMEMKNRRFDLAIQMQGNGSVVNPMISLFGATYTAGYFRKEDYFPGKEFMEYPQGIPEIHRHLLLMQHLGASPLGDELEFPVTEKDESDLRAAALPVKNEKYICIHPGSRGSSRQWPPEAFAAVARQCQEMGYDIVITGVPDELPIVNRVVENMGVTPVIAAGKTSMGAMAALLKHSAGLVSNCTGVSHIASALRTPSIVISMDGEPERWAPLNAQRHKTFDWTKRKDLDEVMLAARHLFSASS